MSTLRSNLARVAAVAAVALTPQFLSGQVSNEQIACGASSGTQQSCKTSGYATAVRLARDLSGNRCRQNSNWGYTDSFIWTNAGCRGDFHVTYRVDAPPPRPLPGAGGTSLVTRCQNSVGQKMRDEIGARDVRFVSGQSIAVNPQVTNVQGEADMQPQRGSTQRYNYLCTFYPREGDRLVVSEYNAQGGTGGGNPTTRIISCGSTGGNSSCNAFGTVASVRLVRADIPRLCRQGSTWGYTQGDIWTKKGCKGDFEVTYAGVPQPR